MIPTPFDIDLDDFLSGGGDRELDVDTIFGKDFDRVLEEFRRHAPEDILVDLDIPGTASLIRMDLVYREVPAGILLMDGERPVGGYLSCDLSLDWEYQGHGLGAEIVIERCLRDGSCPVWDLDEAAYSPAGVAAHEAAWMRVRSNPEETGIRVQRLKEAEKA